MSKRFQAVVLASICLAGSWLGGRTLAQEGAAKGDAGAVRAAAREYVSAMRRGDVKAAAQMWTPDGEYVDAAGQKYKARDILTEQAAAAGQPTDEREVALPDSKLRFVTPDVAVEDGACQSDSAEGGRAGAGSFTAVWVKRDGRWRLDSLRETAVPSTPAPSRLQSLEWLIGEWVGPTDRGAILVSSHWSDGGHYIVREFAERANDGTVTTGEQRIGWDPASKKIKCWTFDSQGGSGEGVWRNEGERWVVETSQVMPDGKTASASAAYTPAGDGRFVWEASRGKIGDQNVPSRRVEFKRAAER